MSYLVIPRESGADVHITAVSREELFRDAIAGTLELVYGRAPETPPSDGQVLPLQAAGDDDRELLSGLLKNCLEEATAGERLLPPTWLSFDSARVTANLRRSTASSEPRPLELRDVTQGAGPFEAQLSFAEASGH